MSLVFISLVWGSTFIIIKKSVGSFEPISFVFLRFGVASIFILILTLPMMKKINRTLIKDGAILGSVLFTVFLFQTIALDMATASEISFLTGLYVLFVPILSAIFLKKYPHIFSLIGVALSATGMMMITLQSGIGISTGQIFGIINAFFIGVHILTTDVYSRKHNVFLLTAVQICTVFILSGVYSFAFESTDYTKAIDSYVVYSIIFTGLFATVLCFFLQTAMQKHTTPTKAAIMFTFEPLSGAFFAFILGNEILSGRQYAGAALIIFAILIAEAGTALKHSKKASQAR